MIYQVGEMVLQKTQDVFQGKVNDVIVCRDVAGDGEAFYTVLVVRDRTIAKKLMELFHEKESALPKTLLRDFVWKDCYLMVFDYVRERSLERFFASEVSNLKECEEMALNMVMECLACGIPYPILFLILKQGLINISKDRKIHFGYAVDLEEFSVLADEKECASLCAKVIFSYIAQIRSARATSYKLLEKKIWKGGYDRFTQLYKDLKMASELLKKEGILQKIRKIFRHNQDRIFFLLMVTCVVLGSLALIMIVSQVFFADVPFFRLFINPFKQIGTESLLQ